MISLKAVRFATTAFFAFTVVTLLCEFSIFRVTSTSMEPTLHDGDYVLVFRPKIVVRRLWPAAWRPTRHAIVVISSPRPETADRGFTGRWDLYVKRIVGEPGDRIRIRNGILIRNGRPVPEAYVSYPSAAIRKSDAWPSEILHKREVVIPDGSVFVLGDNRAGSLDSRIWGPVDRSQVIGVVMRRFRF
jgi:signal peptidase I